MNKFLGKKQNKTIQAKKNVNDLPKRYELKKYTDETLGTGDLQQAVLLPEGEEQNEWIAVNTVDFYNQINMLYGTVTEFCTEEECPIMSAGERFEYHWADGIKYKKPTKMSAPKYIEALMSWIQTQLDNEAVFPSKIGSYSPTRLLESLDFLQFLKRSSIDLFQIGVPFPKTFLTTSKMILRRLFRVYGHIYHSHFERILSLGEQAHLNTSFKHFIFFIKEFNLIDKKELEPMQYLIETFEKKKT